MLVTSHPITFVHQVYHETLLNDDDEDTNEDDYVDIEVSTPCLQGYILSEISFPRDVNYSLPVIPLLLSVLSSMMEKPINRWMIFQTIVQLMLILMTVIITLINLHWKTNKEV